MKVTTWVETAQEVEVEISLDDVMAEISGLGEPKMTQEAMRLLSLCLGAVNRVPDAIVTGMTDLQRKVVADEMTRQAARYMPANVELTSGAHTAPETEN